MDLAVYTQPILVAGLIFIGIAFVIYIPWLIYTYRKYGFLSWSKTIIVFSFIFYFLAALFLVLLPLPETTDTCAQQRPGTQFYNLRLFQFIPDILRNSGIQVKNPSTWIYTFKQPSFYQASFNFLLLLPFGVYLRYFFKARKYWKRALLLGFILTLFYEVTQVTGIYGIYNCPYRIFDVDDLLLNSLGTLVGFFIAPIILALFPKHEEVIAHGKLIESVRPLHRLLALVIDLSLISLLSRVTFLFVQQNTVVEILVNAILYFILLCAVPLLMNGATLGMKLLKIRLVDKETELFTKVGILKMYVSIYAMQMLFQLLEITNRVDLNMDSSLYVFQIFIVIATVVLTVGLIIVIALHIVLVLAGRGKRPFFFDTVANVKAVRKI